MAYWIPPSGVGDYYRLKQPMTWMYYPPPYNAGRQLHTPAGMYAPAKMMGLGCPGCNGTCQGCQSGLGFTMPTDWSLMGAGIGTSLGFPQIPNWGFYGLLALLAVGMVH